jgi:ADP-ribose pyrophosphatase YjhB (NUDIX family)
MKISAGIIIRYKNKILLCHPTNKSWFNSYTPPKGGLNSNESLKQAAIRETFEEVGIKISPDQIPDEPFLIEYTNKGKTYKQVYLYQVEIFNLAEIYLNSETVPKEQLQIEEVDWAGFLTKEEANQRLFWRFNEIYEH